MAILAALGIAAKPLFSPFLNLLTDLVRVPGGSTTAGISMLFLVFGAARIRKPGTGTLMGLTQALLSLGTGIGSNAGILVLITYTLPGAAIDAVLCLPLFRRLALKSRMMAAGSAGAVAGAALTNLLYFKMPPAAFLLFYLFGILSGGLGGLGAWFFYERLRKITD